METGKFNPEPEPDEENTPQVKGEKWFSRFENTLKEYQPLVAGGMTLVGTLLNFEPTLRAEGCLLLAGAACNWLDIWSREKEGKNDINNQEIEEDNG